MKKSFGISLIALLFVSLSVWATPGDYVVVDVRTPEEYTPAHVKGAVHIDIKHSSFESKLRGLDKSKSYKVYCRSGNRSGKAIDIMKGHGFKNLENLGSLSEALEKTKLPCEGAAC